MTDRGADISVPRPSAIKEEHTFLNADFLKKIAKFVGFTIGAWLIGCCIAFCVEWIVKGGAKAALDWCASAPVYFSFTGVLYGMVVFLLGGLTNQLWFSGLLTAVPAVILALVDYFKTAIDGTPLEVQDFGMIGSLEHIIEVAGDLTIPAHAWHAMSALMAVFLVFLFLRKLLCPPTARCRFLIFALGLTLIVSSLLRPGMLLLGQSFGVDMENRIASRISYRDYGLSLGLWRDCFLSANREPEGYSQEYMEGVVERLDTLLTEHLTRRDAQAASGADDPAGLDSIGADTAGQARQGGKTGKSAEGETTEEDEAPNVIFLLSESFYDITRLPELNFSSDPAENYHRLKDESLSGRFYTTYLGYGTGYIEMSMLSGITGKDLKPGANMCFQEDGVYQLFDSIVTPFKEQGYRAEMLHAYNNSLYNRLTTYPLLGFDELLFSPEIQALDLNIQGSPYAGGYYLSDHVFTQALMNRLSDINAQEKPGFLYGISMENHQPFDTDKFGYECQIDVTSTVLNQKELDVAKVMLEGLTRADQALGELTDALRQLDRPTILVFFGDHRPNVFMPDGDTVYSHLGLCRGNDASEWDVEQVADIYSTDYLIWASDAALLGGNAGEEEDTSLTAIGPKLLEIMDISETRYQVMRQAVSQILLVDTDLYCVDSGGKPYWSSGEVELTEWEKELESLRSAVMYDALYGQRYVTEKMNEPVGSG